MKKIEIYDPAMCCPTGLCGPNINPELLRIAAAVEYLRRNGAAIERHNLRDEPQLYVTNRTVNDFLMREGADGLPVTLVDGEVAVRKGYPTNDELTAWTGISLDGISVLNER